MHSAPWGINPLFPLFKFYRKPAGIATSQGGNQGTLAWPDGQTAPFTPSVSFADSALNALSLAPLSNRYQGKRKIPIMMTRRKSCFAIATTMEEYKQEYRSVRQHSIAAHAKFSAFKVI